MPVIVPCPSCQRKVRVADELLGRKVQCPTCNFKFVADEDDEHDAAPIAGATPAGEPSPGDRLEAPPTLPPRFHDEEEEDEDFDRSTPRLVERPGKAQAIAIMTLIGGVVAIKFALGWFVSGLASGGICCLWPGGYYSLVVGIMAVVKGSALLGRSGHLQASPKTIAVMQIINIVNGDVINCVLGILTLTFLNEPEVRRYYRG